MWEAEGGAMTDWRKFDFKSRKFKELVIYFSKRGIDEGLVIGSTKLNKLLFFTDFESYAETGSPITGATYQRLTHGPAPRELLWVRDELLKDEEVRWKPKSGDWDDVLIPRGEADMTLFTDEERAIADRIFEEMRPLNATASSDLSHERSAGWRVLENGETIPYESAFISTAPAPLEAIEMGKRLAQQFGRSSNPA